MIQLQNKISNNDHHECLFMMYCIVDGHQNGNVMKHVNAFVNEIDEIVGNLKFQIKFDSDFKNDGNK